MSFPSLNNATVFSSRRSPVMGRGGMVATSQPLAVAAGLEILAKGGNAADAAVATAAALNVTEPVSTGIGVDCFALFYDGQTGRLTALNGSGRAPAALSLERIHKDIGEINLPPPPPAHDHRSRSMRRLMRSAGPTWISHDGRCFGPGNPPGRTCIFIFCLLRNLLTKNAILAICFVYF
jgi:hypothetical protein